MPQCLRVPGGPAPPPQTCREPGRDPAPTGQRHGAARWGADSPRGGHGGGWEMGWSRCWAAAPAAKPRCPHAAACPEPLPRAGHSPACCPDRHSRLKWMHVPNQALLVPYRFQSAPQGLSPEPHCSAAEQPRHRGHQPHVAAAPCPQDAHQDTAVAALSSVLDAAAAVGTIWPFITGA